MPSSADFGALHQNSFQRFVLPTGATRFSSYCYECHLKYTLASRSLFGSTARATSKDLIQYVAPGIFMSSWQEKSRDPNLELVRRERRDLFVRTFRPSPIERISFITKLVYGKRTLDIGCVTHDATYAALAEWLHGHVAKAASYGLGLDVLKAISNYFGHKDTMSVVTTSRAHRFQRSLMSSFVERSPSISGISMACWRIVERALNLSGVSF